MSTTPETFIKKDIRRNWSAETEVPFDHMGGKNRVLVISTSKVYSGALVTHAAVYFKDGAWRTCTPMEDFNVRLHVTHERCTEKNVERQHMGMVAKLPEILELAREHDAKQAAKQAATA